MAAGDAPLDPVWDDMERYDSFPFSSDERMPRMLTA
jgi:hypothetical protein